MPKAVPLSQVAETSRPPQTVLCYERNFSSGVYKTWQDFLDDTSRLRAVIMSNGAEKWILHCEDCWHFLTAFASLLQCRKQVLLTANVSPAYLDEIRAEGTAVLVDQPITGLPIAGAISVSAMLAETPVSAGKIPPISADETVIMMYTSGTTGKPKAVRQRLTEFEIDNRFILSKWGDEWLKRKVCSTVSQRHIYGLLFSIMLPFTAGVPFRRRRIEFPEEFEALCDDSYMIITVPAFLKRAVELHPERFGLDAPWIFTSGGALMPETAAKTDAAFGFWPVEVYGSTETSGIAYRQSKDGLQWTPFDNAQITQNDAGCLVVRSPYIKDPAGFVTGDLAEMLPDGRFVLKGRADSIVKIEEKRISLPEVEERLVQSGLVSDVCVVAMDDRRQYLAAALVFNEQGKQKFGAYAKARINRHFSEYLLEFFEGVVVPKKWRYVDALPLDAQGKKKKQEIHALFFARPDELHGIVCRKVLEQSGGELLLEIFVPKECDYFDDHFPGFKLLPAVAQIDLVVRLADRHWGTGIGISRVRRVKFTNIVLPDSLVHLKLSYKGAERLLSFKITDAGGDVCYASGTLVPGDGGGAA